jgi:acyl transferase domain-containing protein/SAM-dependent methyltransferase
MTPSETLSPIKRAIVEIRELKAQLERLQREASEPIAIIGLGCRFPGADDPDAYWHLLRNGIDAIGEVPRDRWDVEALFDSDPDAAGKVYTRHGGYLDRVDEFDAAFFGISPREATSLDPQQRLLLEVTWEALEHAGQAPDQLLGTATGVFVGICSNEYGTLQLSNGGADLDAYYGTGNALSVAAGRLSYFFGWRGPSLAIDTACSSSLVAIHLACQSLRHDECRMAVAGGVNLLLRPESTINFCRAHMLAPDGRCKTFDASADGYSRAEGAGVVVLKRLSYAIEDGDRILAVVLGSAVNQDGRSGGLTVPNGPSQEAVIRDALARAHIQPADVNYIEAHGTGTKLGDPIEVHSLRAVFGEGRAASQPLIIGSAKTNVGHLEAAAGIAGVTKVVLSMQHGEIPRHLHFQQLNPHIDMQGAPIEVASERRAWTPSPRRIAGVSSFGFSGTNAHVIIADPPPQPVVPASVPRGSELVLLSARTRDALRAVAARLADRLERDASLSLSDTAFTLATGRAHLACRATFSADSPSDLVAQLRAFVTDATSQVLLGELVSLDPQVPVWICGDVADDDGDRLIALRSRCRAFAAAVDGVVAALTPLFGSGWATGLLARTRDGADVPRAITSLVYQHALGDTFAGWGIQPGLVSGHGIGSYVAASLCGALTIEDAARLLTSADDAYRVQLTPAHTTLHSARTGTTVASADVVKWLRNERVAPALATISANFDAPVTAIGGDSRGSTEIWQDLLQTIAHCYRSGVGVSWPLFYHGQNLQRVALPAYPFERQKYWAESARVGAAGVAVAAAQAAPQYSLDADGGRDGSVLSLETVQSAIQDRLQHEASAIGLNAYAAAIPDLEELATAYAISAMHTLGWREQPGVRLNPDEFGGRLGVVPGQRTLFRQILKFFAEEGMLSAAGGEYVVQRSLAAIDTEAVRLRFGDLHPSASHELTLVARCGTHLAAVLQGRKQPLEVLFPNGSSETVEHVYARSPMASFYQALAGRVVGELVRSLPRARVLRVLEVGAGTGATSAAVLSALADCKPRYVFSDVSPAFLNRASEKFREYTFVEYCLFDVERSPDNQPLPVREFDLIIAANVLHATSDIRESLTRLQTLLAPNGVVLLAEATRPRRWLDLTFGLTDGWWRFSDRALRPSSPLLSRESWLSVLTDSGLADAMAVPVSTSPDDPFHGHALFLGRGRSSVPQRDTEVSFTDQLAGALAAEREDLLVGFVRDQLRNVLRLPRTTVVDRRHRLVELGLDSLMVLEFRNRLESGLGWKDILPATLVFDYPTIDALATYLESKIAAAAPEAAASGQHSVPAMAGDEDALKQLMDLTDDEVTALLEKKLESL